MNFENRVGLGNAVKSETIIFHGIAIDYDSIGRIGDQVVFWMKKHHQISQKFCGEFKVLIQTMIEFGVQGGPESNNQFEVAIEDEITFFALRFKNFIVKTGEEAEKELAQFWLNSTNTQLVKKVLLPNDVVEIRYIAQLDLIEFRILRALGTESKINNRQSFKVIVDIEPELKSDHQNFIDISDFDNSFWLKQVYDNKKNRVKTGELYSSGKSIQAEEEWAIAVVDRELSEINQHLKHKLLSLKLGKNLHTDISEVDYLKNDATSLQNKIPNFIFKSVDPVLFSEKNKFLEMLLREKEMTIQKFLNHTPQRDEDLKILESQWIGTDEKSEFDSSLFFSKNFKDKALKIIEMAKRLQSEKQDLLNQIEALKKISELLNADRDEEGGSVTLIKNVNVQFDEFSKKIERMNRALNVEKQKVRSLLDRVIVAEKEAQNAEPLIETLESKIEVANKNLQLLKKEIENLKHKLLQSESEKNKIKNELIKTESQIQTLIKRQAS